MIVRASPNTLAGADFGMNAARRNAPPACATTSPATPPSAPSRMLSVRSCVTSRRPLMPSARRTAISRLRLSARASRRFATLAQAMSSTMSATPLIQVATFASWLVFGPRWDRIDAASARGFAISIGVWRGSLATSTAKLRLYAFVRSALAAWSLTPGFRIAIVCDQVQWYVVHQVSPFWLNAIVLAYELTGMYAIGGWSGHRPAN